MSLRPARFLAPVLPVVLLSACAPVADRPPPLARVAIGAPLARLALPPIDGPDDPALPLVVIDAGHGGHDPGSIGTGAPEGNIEEKALTLSIARTVRDALLMEGRMRVALTRDSDRFLVLAERSDVARRMKADLFLSIHADSAPDTLAHGATLYTLSETASDAEAARLAARENRSGLTGIDEGDRIPASVSSILIDLRQRDAMARATRAVDLIVRESDTVRFRPDPHRFAGFIVLKAPDTPSILYETGYISNAADVALLRTAAGQRMIAAGLAKALRIYFAERAASDGRTARR